MLDYHRRTQTQSSTPAVRSLSTTRGKVDVAFVVIYKVENADDNASFVRAKPVAVHTEDDILHLENKELPTFGNVLSPSDSERFVQFLTAPYIRIPLIMDFFANGDPTRLSRH